MRSALGIGEEHSSLSKSPSQFVDLTSLCCQAAGGHPEWADDLTVVWLFFYTAAHIMDKVQDKDEPEPWWRDLGPGGALSAATGFYFSASLALSQLSSNPHTHVAAKEIVSDLYNSFLVMTSGQFAEMIDSQPSLEDYWKYAEAKSGAFFALACRSGAKLATSDKSVLDGFHRFGHHLGMLVQLKDDLDDIRPPSEGAVAGQRLEISRSLPVIFAQNVLPDADRERLRVSLSEAPWDAQAAGEVIRLLDQSNAAVYLVAEMERHRQMAMDAIHQAVPPSTSREALEYYLK